MLACHEKVAAASSLLGLIDEKQLKLALSALTGDPDYTTTEQRLSTRTRRPNKLLLGDLEEVNPARAG